VVFKISFDDLVKRSQDDARKAGSSTGNPDADNFLKGLSTVVSGVNLVEFRAQYGAFKAGDRFTKQDRVTLIKSEKGWRLSQDPAPLAL
jgi:hypothetical protein